MNKPAVTPLMRHIRETNLPDDMLALWFLGQAGFMIKWKDVTVMFDPYLTNSVFENAGEPWNRAFASPLAPTDCVGIDYVVCSHHHDDHMDRATLQAIAEVSPSTRFVVPRAHLHLMQQWEIGDDRVQGISDGDRLTLREGLVLHAHAAMHEQFEQDLDGEHLYLSYVAAFGSKLKLLHAGDTIGFPALADWLKPLEIDVALLPINGRDFTRREQGIIGNMNYREAADLGAAIDAKLLVPMHIGMFPHNDENPAYFVDYLYRSYPRQPFHLFTPGERFIYAINKT